MNGFDIVMLYSGGADSMLMLKLAQMAGKRPYCLLVDYGQKHVKELEYAKSQLEEDGISWQTVKVSGLNINSGLTGNLTDSRWDNVHSMNVPARNSWFLSLAASVAENLGITEIWIGCDMSDYYGEFPDCKQEYIGRMNKVFKVAFTRPIEIVAPLLGISKEMALSILEGHFRVDLSRIHSGYEEPKSSCMCDGSCGEECKGCD